MNKNHALISGPMLPAIFRLAGPAVLMMILQGTYNFIDTYFVGFLGAESLAGISTGGFILWMTFALAHLFGVGVSAKVARRIGEQNREEADRTAARGVVYAFFGAVLIALPLYFFMPLLFNLMHAPSAVAQAGRAYLLPLIIGLPTIFLSFVLTGIFNAAGDTRTPFMLMLLSLAVNALLDPLFIFGLSSFPELGIAGAALATVVSRLLWLVLAWRQLRRRDSAIALARHGRLGLSLKDLSEVIRIGAPKAATGVLFSAVYMALTRITADYGTPNIAALRIGHMYEGFSFFTALGFSIAAATLVGQNLGAGKPDRAARAAWLTGGMVFALTTGVGFVFRFGASELAGIFSTDPAVVSAGATYLMILAWSQPFMGIEIVMEGSFSGAGNTLPPMLIQLPLTILRYPAALLLAYSAGLGVAGVWWAISGSSVIKGLLMMWWFQQRRWVHTKV